MEYSGKDSILSLVDYLDVGEFLATCYNRGTPILFQVICNGHEEDRICITYHKA